METLSNILASFDIFQVIINAFPRIFQPLMDSLQGMFAMLYDFAAEQFSSHPGLISGTVIFFTVYAIWSGLSKLRRAIVPARSVPGHPSR
ncbi:MAG: hypothetical protein Q8M08_00830 [Bacteroidales bacterium]|nr:hypothetical protein [Bacteroidales bacterium]